MTEKLAALKLCTMSRRSLLPRAHDIINRNIAALLYEGLVVHSERRNVAYVLTARGREALAMNGR